MERVKLSIMGEMEYTRKILDILNENCKEFGAIFHIHEVEEITFPEVIKILKTRDDQ